MAGVVLHLTEEENIVLSAPVLRRLTGTKPSLFGKQQTFRHFLGLGIDSPPYYLQHMPFIAIFKNKANSRRNGTSLSSQKAKLSEKHIVSRSEEHPGSVP